MAKGTLKQKQDTEDKTQFAYKYYRSQGWTPEQASGIVGNLLRESNLNPNAVGDGGKARGLAQWHPDRQAKAKELYGDRWTDFENQLKFVNWELNNTEKKAGDKLRNAKSVWESGAVISNDYERPKVKFHADDTRQAHVSDIYRKYSKTQLTDADKQMFRASYARDVAPYMNQPTNNLTNFEIPTSSGTFASVPDVYKEPAKEENKEVAELQQKSAEKNFIEAYQSLQKQPIAQQEQEEAVQALPQKDIMDTFNEVSSFIDTPLAQEGGTWTTQQAKVKAEKDAKLKLLLKQEKNIVQKLIDEKGKKKQEPLKTQDNTKVNTKNRPELFSKVARNKTDKEIAEERQAKIDESIKYQDVPYTQDNWREVLAKTTQATGDKFRIFPEEDSFIDNYLNPAAMIGSMASNLGQAPLQAEQSDSILPYITSVGTPLAVGAMAGIGANSTGQFVNNLANPLAGTGDLVNNLGNKYLPNAYKLNPLAFKPKSDALYRGIAESGFNDAIESNMIRAPKGSGFGDEVFTSMDFEIAQNYSRGNNPMGYKVIKNKDGSFNVPEINTNDKSYIAEIPKTLIDNNTQIIGNEVRFDRAIPTDNVNFYKEDWLQGYKQVEVPKTTQNFNSEINWANWNKEIPDNPQLIQEYNAIEQTSKSNGSWMKNPDGSEFVGSKLTKDEIINHPKLSNDITNEEIAKMQFLQQNSENFKKAFSKSKVMDETGSPIRMYHGSPKDNIVEFSTPNRLDGFESKSATTKNTDYTFFTPTKYKSKIFGDNTYEVYIDSKRPINVDGIRIPGEGEYKDMQFPLIWNPEKVKNKEFYDSITNLDFDNIKMQLLEDQEKRGIKEMAVPFGNNVKSAIGNNGMFDMNNPNIYKSVAPIAGASYLATQNNKQETPQFQSGGIIKDNQGQRKFPGEITEISSPNISMENVPYPVLGVSKETGERKMMFPNQQYTFSNTKNVIEYPQLTEKEKAFLKALQNGRR